MIFIGFILLFLGTLLLLWFIEHAKMPYAYRAPLFQNTLIKILLFFIWIILILCGFFFIFKSSTVAGFWSITIFVAILIRRAGKTKRIVNTLLYNYNKLKLQNPNIRECEILFMVLKNYYSDREEQWLRCFLNGISNIESLIDEVLFEKKYTIDKWLGLGA